MKHVTHSTLPPIVLADSDLEVLTTLLASDLGDRFAVEAEALEAELVRATVVPRDRLPDDVVRLWSRVTYRAGANPPAEVTLVPPNEIDPARGRVSVLSPIGTALLGLRPGQTIEWTTPAGRTHAWTVIAVAHSPAVTAVAAEAAEATEAS